jgi:hypothetical protein
MYWRKIGKVVEALPSRRVGYRTNYSVSNTDSINRNLSGTCFAHCKRGFHPKLIFLEFIEFAIERAKEVYYGGMESIDIGRAERKAC